MTNTAKILLSASFGVLFLSGCQNGQSPFGSMSWPSLSKQPAPATAAANTCPSVGLMPELGVVSQLRNGEVLSETAIDSLNPVCNVTKELATIRLSVGFKGQLGPAGIKDASNEANYSLPYLIAVINPQGEIISKDVFAISLTYKKGETKQVYNDLIEQIIPLPQGASAADYKVLVGFQLSPEELAYNRKISAKSPPK